MNVLLAAARAHWKAIAAAAALALAFAGGYAAHRPPPAPAVALREDTASQKAVTTQTAKTDAKGSEREVTRTFAPPLPGCPTAPPVLASETVVTRGPEVITEHVAEQETTAEQTHLSLTVTPPPAPPGWAVGIAVDDLPGARLLRFELDRRLVGNLWLTAGVVPARHEVGLGLRMEW